MSRGRKRRKAAALAAQQAESGIAVYPPGARLLAAAHGLDSNAQLMTAAHGLSSIALPMHPPPTIRKAHL